MAKKKTCTFPCGGDNVVQLLELITAGSVSVLHSKQTRTSLKYQRCPFPSTRNGTSGTNEQQLSQYKTLALTGNACKIYNNE